MEIDSDLYDPFKAQCVMEGKAVYHSIQDIIARNTKDGKYNKPCEHCVNVENIFWLRDDIEDVFKPNYCPHCGRRL